MEKQINASTLYNYIQCPRRVQLDLFGDPSKKDRVSAFVELLWERGNAFERETMNKLVEPFADLRSLEPREKEHQTLRLMRQGEKIIYGGRIRTDTLLGEPDLLVRKGNGYVAGDIKSGAGIEGVDDESDGKLKRHYAVQLALYTDILGNIVHHHSPALAGRILFSQTRQQIRGERRDAALAGQMIADQGNLMWIRRIVSRLKHLDSPVIGPGPRPWPTIPGRRPSRQTNARPLQLKGRFWP